MFFDSPGRYIKINAVQYNINVKVKNVKENTPNNSGRDRITVAVSKGQADLISMVFPSEVLVQKISKKRK